MISHWLGCVPFVEASQIQKQMHELTQQDQQTRILALEHPAVVTLGVRGSVENDLPFGSEVLKRQNIEIKKIDRGGQATLHSPGQLVIYPILAIEKCNLTVHEFVMLLMQTTVNTLLSVGIESHIGECQTGVFTKFGKIAFCGLRIDRKVSRHGISINISNDLQLFDWIRPCGCQKAAMDKVDNHNQNMTTEDFYKIWLNIFTEAVNARHNSLLISSQSLDC